MTNVTPAAAYSTLAPFENGIRDYAALKAMAVTSTTFVNQNMPAATTGEQRRLPLLPPRPRDRLREHRCGSST